MIGIGTPTSHSKIPLPITLSIVYFIGATFQNTPQFPTGMDHRVESGSR